MEASSILDIERPWIYAAAKSARDDLASGLRGAVGYAIRWLDGEVVLGADDLFLQLAREFSFPDFYGQNWPATFEFLTSLSWLPARGYLIVVDNYESFLRGSGDDLEVFIETMQRVGRRWSNAFGLGGEWGQDGVPFNTLFLVPDDQVEAVEAEVQRWRK